MKGTFQQLQLALTPLGESKGGGSFQLKYNCPNCENNGLPTDKFNLEVKYVDGSGMYHCWCCNIHGGLYNLVKQYGYKDYAVWFKQNKDSILEKATSTILELPKTVALHNHKDAYQYVLDRNIHPSIIKQRNIRYCYDGKYKGCIIFPSYHLDGQLSYYVAHNYIHRKYKEKKSSEHICFYEDQIDKNLPIILTEGVYDALSVPNAIPLLGLKLSKPLLDFIANCDVILAVDPEVDYVTKKKLIRDISSVAKTLKEFAITPYKDLNDCYIKDSSYLKEKLNEYYK